MDQVQAGFLMVAAIWAALNAQVSGYQAVNSKRDVIVSGIIDDQPISLEHRWLLFWSDWLPLKIGLALASLSFALVIFATPLLVDDDKPHKHILVTACYICGTVPIFSTLAWVVMGVFDAKFILKTLRANTATKI